MIIKSNDLNLLLQPKPMEMKWAEKSSGVSFDESGKHCSRDTEGSFEVYI